MMIASELANGKVEDVFDIAEYIEKLGCARTLFMYFDAEIM